MELHKGEMGFIPGKYAGLSNMCGRVLVTNVGLDARVCRVCICSTEADATQRSRGRCRPSTLQQIANLHLKRTALQSSAKTAQDGRAGEAGETRCRYLILKRVL